MYNSLCVPIYTTYRPPHAFFSSFGLGMEGRPAGVTAVLAPDNDMIRSSPFHLPALHVSTGALHPSASSIPSRAIHGVHPEFVPSPNHLFPRTSAEQRRLAARRRGAATEARAALMLHMKE